jgi:hypothetical protein
MACAICRSLEAELERLEHDHAVRLAALHGQWFTQTERHRARLAEKKSLEVLETLQGQVHEHKLKHQNK